MRRSYGSSYDPNMTDEQLAAEIKQHAKLDEAARAYDPYRHDPDSIGFDDSYTGPSERELMGGCNRCGGLDDCYCGGPEEGDEGDSPEFIAFERMGEQMTALLEENR